MRESMSSEDPFMVSQPLLTTGRLLLRPFALSDAPDVQRLAGAREIADTTLNVPHPYADGMAEEWIGSHEAGYAEGSLAIYAVVHRPAEELLGAVGLVIDPQNALAELGYWIGVLYWGRGYATEAARALIDFGFGQLGLNRIQARHLLRNPASGRVMEKLGMTREGTFRQAVRKWERFEDVALYAMLSSDRDEAVPHT